MKLIRWVVPLSAAALTLTPCVFAQPRITAPAAAKPPPAATGRPTSLAPLAAATGKGASGAAARTPPAMTPTGTGKPAPLANPPATSRPPSSLQNGQPPSGNPDPGFGIGPGIGAGGANFPEGMPAEKAIATECKDKIPPNKKFKIDFRGEVELSQLVQWLAPTLCRPVIVPQNLRQQKVTIYSPGLVTAEEAQRLFLASLTSMGLTVQPEGGKGHEVFTIIESNRAHELPVPLYGPDAQAPSSSAFVTKLIRMKNITTDEILQTLNRLKTKDGDIVAFAPAGTLIITDLSENIRRMEAIINQLDVQPLGAEKIWVHKLHNTAASEMAAMLEKIFQPSKGAAQPGGRPGGRAMHLAQSVTSPPAVTPGAAPGSATETSGPAFGSVSVSQIIPEDRSNTLIIVASDKAFSFILSLIQRLDQAGGPLDNAGDRIHVHFLNNATADEIAATLSGLGVGVSGSRGRTGARATGGPAGGTPGQAGALFEGEVKVAADKPTNSLVIVASGRDYLTVRDLVRKLDITRRQVFIEATILEVSLDKARKLGAAFHGGGTVLDGDNKSLLFGGSEPNGQANSLFFSPAALTGLAAGLRGPAIPGADTLLGLPPGQSVPSFGVFIQALQNNNDVNVVSMPHILTSDNEKATIQVGRNLPFPGSLGGFPGAGGAAAGAAAAFGIGTSVQRQDVALKMDVTPHVNDSDMVRLELDAEISDVASENFNGLGPATDKRTVKTTVSVRDQQSVVIGGLVKDRIAESIDKVPLLGDIPILGYLFKFTRKTILKQNLLIILTPYVIKDPMDLRRIFERKIRDRKEFLERYSAFQDEHNYDPEIDYRRKRGLLEEINRTAIEAELEAAELRTAQASMQERFQEGPVEPVDIPRGRGGALRPGAGERINEDESPGTQPVPSPPSPRERPVRQRQRERMVPNVPQMEDSVPPPTGAPALPESPRGEAPVPQPATAGDR